MVDQFEQTKDKDPQQKFNENINKQIEAIEAYRAEYKKNPNDKNRDSIVTQIAHLNVDLGIQKQILEAKRETDPQKVDALEYDKEQVSEMYAATTQLQTRLSHKNTGDDMLLLISSFVTEQKIALDPLRKENYLKEREEERKVNIAVSRMPEEQQQALEQELDAVKPNPLPNALEKEKLPGYPPVKGIDVEKRKDIMNIVLEQKDMITVNTVNNKQTLVYNGTVASHSQGIDARYNNPSLMNYTFFAQYDGLGAKAETDRYLKWKYAIAVAMYQTFLDAGIEEFKITFDPDNGISYLPEDQVKYANENIEKSITKTQEDIKREENEALFNNPGSLKVSSYLEVLGTAAESNYRGGAKNKKFWNDYGNFIDISNKTQNKRIETEQSAWETIKTELTGTLTSIGVEKVPTTLQEAIQRYGDLVRGYKNGWKFSDIETTEMITLMFVLMELSDVSDKESSTYESKLLTETKGYDVQTHNAMKPIVQSCEDKKPQDELSWKQYSNYNKKLSEIYTQRHFTTTLNNNIKTGAYDNIALAMLYPTEAMKTMPKFGHAMCSSEGLKYRCPTLYGHLSMQKARVGDREQLGKDLAATRDAKNQGALGIEGKAQYYASSLMLGLGGAMTNVMTAPANTVARVHKGLHKVDKRWKGEEPDKYVEQSLNLWYEDTILAQLNSITTVPSEMCKPIYSSEGGWDASGLTYHLSGAVMNTTLLMGAGAVISAGIGPMLAATFGVEATGFLTNFVSLSIAGGYLNMHHHLERGFASGLRGGELLLFGLVSNFVETGIESASGMTATSFFEQIPVSAISHGREMTKTLLAMKYGKSFVQEVLGETGEEVLNEGVMQAIEETRGQYNTDARFEKKKLGDYINTAVITVLSTSTHTGLGMVDSYHQETAQADKDKEEAKLQKLIDLIGTDPQMAEQCKRVFDELRNTEGLSPLQQEMKDNLATVLGKQATVDATPIGHETSVQNEVDAAIEKATSAIETEFAPDINGDDTINAKDRESVFSTMAEKDTDKRKENARNHIPEAYKAQYVTQKEIILDAILLAHEAANETTDFVHDDKGNIEYYYNENGHQVPKRTPDSLRVKLTIMTNSLVEDGIPWKDSLAIAVNAIKNGDAGKVEGPQTSTLQASYQLKVDENGNPIIGEDGKEMRIERRDWTAKRIIEEEIVPYISKDTLSIDEQKKVLQSLVNLNIALNKIPDDGKKKEILQPTSTTQMHDLFLALQQKITDPSLTDPDKVLQASGLSCEVIPEVILQPDNMKIITGSGLGRKEVSGQSFDRVGLIMRICNSLGVKPSDVKKGTLKENQMRTTSYVSMYIEKYDKTVFVCNSYGEATFVVDGKLEKSDLLSMSKQTLTRGKVIFREGAIDSWIDSVTDMIIKEKSSEDLAGGKKSDEVVMPGGTVDVSKRQEGQGPIIVTRNNKKESQTFVILSQASLFLNKYVGNNGTLVKDFEKWAQNKEGYYPKKGKNGSNLVNLASKILREEYAKEKNLILQDYVVDVSDWTTGEGTITVTKENEDGIKEEEKEDIKEEVEVVIISEKSPFVNKYIGEKQGMVSDFVARAKDEEGYYPKKGKNNTKLVHLASKVLREKYAKEKNLILQDYVVDVSNWTTGEGSLPIIKDGKETQERVIIITERNPFFNQYIGRNPDICAEFTQWALNPVKEGYYPQKGKTKSKLVNLASKALRDKYVAEKGLKKKESNNNQENEVTLDSIKSSLSALPADIFTKSPEDGGFDHTKSPYKEITKTILAINDPEQTKQIAEFVRQRFFLDLPALTTDQLQAIWEIHNELKTNPAKLSALMRLFGIREQGVNQSDPKWAFCKALLALGVCGISSEAKAVRDYMNRTYGENNDLNARTPEERKLLNVRGILRLFAKIEYTEELFHSEVENVSHESIAGHLQYIKEFAIHSRISDNDVNVNMLFLQRKYEAEYEKRIGSGHESAFFEDFMPFALLMRPEQLKAYFEDISLGTDGQLPDRVTKSIVSMKEVLQEGGVVYEDGSTGDKKLFGQGKPIENIIIDSEKEVIAWTAPQTVREIGGGMDIDTFEAIDAPGMMRDMTNASPEFKAEIDHCMGSLMDYSFDGSVYNSLEVVEGDMSLFSSATKVPSLLEVYGNAKRSFEDGGVCGAPKMFRVGGSCFFDDIDGVDLPEIIEIGGTMTMNVNSKYDGDVTINSPKLSIVGRDVALDTARYFNADLVEVGGNIYGADLVSFYQPNLRKVNDINIDFASTSINIDSLQQCGDIYNDAFKGTVYASNLITGGVLKFSIAEGGDFPNLQNTKKLIMPEAATLNIPQLEKTNDLEVNRAKNIKILSGLSIEKYLKTNRGLYNSMIQQGVFVDENNVDIL